MKLKLNVLALSIATTILVLALALSQSPTNSTAAIHELTATEMAAITGTSNCKQPWVFHPSGINARWIDDRWVEISDLCGTGAACFNDDNQCGEDYYYFSHDKRCWGAPVVEGWNGCDERDTGNPLYTHHNCYCYDRPESEGDICKDDTTDSSSESKETFRDTNHYCPGE